MSRERWVYVRTGPAPQVNPGVYGRAPSVRAEVLSSATTYEVRMPDGSERTVSFDDLQMARTAPDPVIEEVVDGHGDQRTRQTHPSFGMIGIYHTTGGRSIHGSRVDSHQHYVTISIKAGAHVDHSLGQDWHGGGYEVVEVALSAARFAEFIATPNRGDGVPCSITRHAVDGGPGLVPQVTAHKTEAAQVIDRVKALGQEITAKQAEARDEIAALLSKVSAKKRAEVLRAFDQGARVINDTAPFLIGQGVEALEARVAESKAEIEAAIATGLRSAGIDAIGGDPLKLAEHMRPRLLADGTVASTTGKPAEVKP